MSATSETNPPTTYINGEPVASDEIETQPVVDEQVEAEHAEQVEAEDLVSDEDLLDDIEKQIAHREWNVKGHVRFVNRRNGIEEREFDHTYVQKPLSYTAMLQFTGLVGDRITSAMSGPDGLSLDDVLGEAQGIVSASQVLSRADFAGIDAFVKGFAKLAMYIPDVIEEAQCIWLRVPLNERPAVKEIWSRSPDDGGLSMAEGEEMLETFLAQNYAEVEDFFLERLPRQIALVQRLRAARQKQKGAASPRSRRSRPTPPPTPSQ